AAVAAAAVVDRVLERCRTAGILGNRVLQGCAVQDRLHLADGGLTPVDRGDEHVTVGVVVVVEHREQRGAAGAHTVVVVLGDRHGVLLTALGQRGLHRLLAVVLLVLALALRRNQNAPVVDALQARIGEPRRTADDVV